MDPGGGMRRLSTRAGTRASALTRSTRIAGSWETMRPSASPSSGLRAGRERCPPLGRLGLPNDLNESPRSPARA